MLVLDSVQNSQTSKAGIKLLKFMTTFKKLRLFNVQTDHFIACWTLRFPAEKSGISFSIKRVT